MTTPNQPTTVVDLVREYFSDATDADADYILWEFTGYPSFWPSGFASPELALRYQLAGLKVYGFPQDDKTPRPVADPATLDHRKLRDSKSGIERMEAAGIDCRAYRERYARKHAQTDAKRAYNARYWERNKDRLNAARRTRDISVIAAFETPAVVEVKR